MAEKRGIWALLGILIVGAVIGVIGVALTTHMVHVTSTTEFCSTACHSMQWVAKAYERGPHAKTRTGVVAGCGDCHIPYESGNPNPLQYLVLLTHKAKAGIHDAIGEMSGVISTEAKWTSERDRLSNGVKEFMANNNSLTCRGCHDLTRIANPAKPHVAEMHAPLAKADKVVCVECHANVGHVYDEPAKAAPATTPPAGSEAAKK